MRGNRSAILRPEIPSNWTSYGYLCSQGTRITLIGQARVTYSVFELEGITI